MRCAGKLSCHTCTVAHALCLKPDRQVLDKASMAVPVTQLMTMQPVDNTQMMCYLSAAGEH